MRLALASTALVGLFALACTHPKPEPAEASVGEDVPPKPAQPEPEPKPEPKPAPAADAVTQELTVVPGEMSVSEDGKTMSHCLDCNRKASTYTYCDFDKDAFVAAVGTTPADQAVTVRVTMVPKSRETGIEGDPQGARPEGGFTHERHTCSVEAVLP